MFLFENNLKAIPVLSISYTTCFKTKKAKKKAKKCGRKFVSKCMKTNKK